MYQTGDYSKKREMQLPIYNCRCRTDLKRLSCPLFPVRVKYTSKIYHSAAPEADCYSAFLNLRKSFLLPNATLPFFFFLPCLNPSLFVMIFVDMVTILHFPAFILKLSFSLPVFMSSGLAAAFVL